MSTFTPAQTGFSRVFLIEGRARPDHQPSYESCLKAGALSWALGDITKIECPDPDTYGDFVEIGNIQGAKERVTIPVSGRYAADLASTLLELARRRCPADVHVHFGACTDPSDFNTFTKAVVLEDARITNFSTDELGALGSDEAAKVDETADISAKDVYEVLQIAFQSLCADTVTNPVADVVICDVLSCGDCEDESSGCEKVYAVTLASPGSPGTAPDLVYTLDGGVTCCADDIDSLDASEDADALACVDVYVVVVSNADGGLHYTLRSELDCTASSTWTRQATGFVVGGEPNDIWSVGQYAFIVGDTGYVYGTANPPGGVTVLDAGVATDQNLNAVHAISEEFAVAVGDSNAVVFTENGQSFGAVTGPAVGVNLNCVWVKDENQWFVGDANGALWYTLDQGINWTQITLPGAGYTSINDIAFSNDSVGYVGATISGPAGRVLRTYNGGYTWVIMPEGVANLPASDAINAVAACTFDANFVAAVGLADDAADGVFFIGQD